MLLALLLACTPAEPGPASTGSRSAQLAARAGAIARDADALAARSRDVEGDIDAWRAASPADRPAIEARIAATAADVEAEAQALEARVRKLEEDARVWGEPHLPEPEAGSAAGEGGEATPEGEAPAVTPPR